MLQIPPLLPRQSEMRDRCCVCVNMCVYVCVRVCVHVCVCVRARVRVCWWGDYGVLLQVCMYSYKKNHS